MIQKTPYSHLVIVKTGDGKFLGYKFLTLQAVKGHKFIISEMESFSAFTQLQS
jgi:hypothetical protein